MMFKPMTSRLYAIRKLSVLTIISLLGLFLWSSEGKTQPMLKWADFYTMINEVLINQTEATNEDELVPGDLLQTGSDSRADLIFNEGTVVRATAQTQFQFEHGMRRFHIAEGTALFILRPGGGELTVETPTARVRATEATIWTTYDAEQKLTKVGVFGSEKAVVRVSNAQGENTVELKPGQKVNVMGNQVGEVNTFSLQTFYETSGIADGLETGDNLERYPSQVRETLETAQENTSEALEQQQEQLKQGSNTVDQNLDANNQPDLLGTELGTELGTIQVIDITPSRVSESMRKLNEF